MSVRGPTLRIVAINDVYSLENLPRLRTLVAHHQTTNPADAFLVTLAGDFVSPSILSSLDSGRAMVDCMNAVGVTHAILGNHEDDITVDELRARVRELHAVLIGTNVPGFEPPVPSNVVIDVAAPAGRSVRVGMVGVVMDDPAVYRRIPFGVARVEPANEAAMREATRLVKEEKCVCVLPMTHQTMAEDRALAHDERAPKFPVIIGGHEHVPFVEQDEGTWIIKAGSDATNAVIVDLAWPVEPPAIGPDLPSVLAILEPVATYAEDPALRARVDTLMARVHDLESATLMTLGDEALSSVGTRAHPASLGTLICSLVRDALDAQACVFNGGGIRGGRDYKKHFTYGDLKNEVPFDNEVVAVNLPGRVIRDAVAWSRRQSPNENGGYLQVDDRMKVDEPSHMVTHIAGEPIDLDREYCVALVRDFFRGMDHIDPLVAFAQADPDKIPPVGSGRDVKLVLVDAFAIALWKRLGGFDAIDANHDGVVTAQEIAAAVSRVTLEAPSSITGDLVLRAVDANHDQGVSREEAPAAGASFSSEARAQQPSKP